MTANKVFNIEGKTYIVTVSSSKDASNAEVPISEDENTIVIDGKRSDIKEIDGYKVVPLDVIENIINEDYFTEHGTSAFHAQNIMLGEIATTFGVDDESKMYDHVFLDENEKQKNRPPADKKIAKLFKIENNKIVANENKPCFQIYKSICHARNLIKIGDTEKLNIYLTNSPHIDSTMIYDCLKYKNYNCLRVLRTCGGWNSAVNFYIQNRTQSFLELNELETYLVLENFVPDFSILFFPEEYCRCKPEDSILCEPCKRNEAMENGRKKIFENGYVTIDHWKTPC